MDAERAHLNRLADRLRAGLGEIGADTGASTTQIVPVLVGEEQETLGLAEALNRDGFLAGAIRPPTVPKGMSRLRFSLSADHAEADIDRLIGAVARARPARRPAA
jgi:8-amino-7-oxononanoate synthase